MNESIRIAVPILGVFGLFCALMIFRRIRSLPAGEGEIADIAEQIHLGAMAGTVDLVKRCFTSLETRGDVLRFNPMLPPEIRSLRMDICYRGHSLRVLVSAGTLSVETLRCSEPRIQVACCEDVREVKAGEVLEWRL